MRALTVVVACIASATGFACWCAGAPANVAVVGDTIQVSGTPGRDEWFVYEPAGSQSANYLAFEEQHRPQMPGPGCVLGGPAPSTVLLCERDGVTRVQFVLGDGVDSVEMDRLNRRRRQLPYAASLDMGAGGDKINVSVTGALTARLGPGRDEADVFSVSGPSEIYGDEGNDLLRPHGAAPALLDGGAGSDALVANSVAETMIGGEGNDWFITLNIAGGREGDYKFSCGPGRDRIYVSNPAGLPADCPANIPPPGIGQLRANSLELTLDVSEPVSGPISLRTLFPGALLVSPRQVLTFTPQQRTIRMPLTKRARKAVAHRSQIKVRLRGYVKDAENEITVLNGMNVTFRR